MQITLDGAKDHRAGRAHTAIVSNQRFEDLTCFAGRFGTDDHFGQEILASSHSAAHLVHRRSDGLGEDVQRFEAVL